MEDFSLEIFVSHSGEDDDLAASLVDLLRSALLIPADKIRCTSVDGYRLPAGADSDNVIRREVRSSKVFIGLLTATSWRSAYVLFELGARWGAQLQLMPLLAGIEPKELSGPLKGLNALDCREEGQVFQIVEEIGLKLERKQESVSSFRHKLSSLVRQAQSRSSTVSELQGNLSKLAGPFPPFGYFYKDDDRDNPLCPKCAQDQPPREGYLAPAESWNRGMRRSCRLCHHTIYEKEMDLSPRPPLPKRTSPWG